MGWGSKAIEIRAVDNGQLDGVFMHKRTQKLRFLCERNDKVGVSCIYGSIYLSIYLFIPFIIHMHIYMYLYKTLYTCIL